MLVSSRDLEGRIPVGGDAANESAGRYWIALQAPADGLECGGKAAGLALARAFGARIPETFVVPRAALRAVLDSAFGLETVETYLGVFEGLPARETDARHRDLANEMRALDWPKSVESELRAGFADLLMRAPHGLAVRSSATCEDSAQASFAGVFESHLGARTVEQALNQVRDCWIASWAPRAIRYRKRLGIAVEADAMAVVVQPLLAAGVSGVCTTADPDTGDPQRIVIHAVRGLAAELLAGGESGAGVGGRYTFSLGLNTAVYERERPQRTELVPRAEGGLEVRALLGSGRGGGSARTSTESEAGANRELEEEEVHALVELALELDEQFGHRLDLEWAMVDDEWFVVQARPLTALPEFFPHELSAEERGFTWRPAWFLLPLTSPGAPSLLTPLYQHYSEAEMWERYQPDDFSLTSMHSRQLDLHGHRFFEEGPRPTFLDHFADVEEYEPWLDEHESRYRGRWDRREEELHALERDVTEAVRVARTAAELLPTMFAIQDRLWDLNSFGWSGPQALGWMCDLLWKHRLEQLGAEIDGDALLAGGDSYTSRATRAMQELGRAIREDFVRRAFEERPLGEVLPYLAAEYPGSEFLANYDSMRWRIARCPWSWQERPGFWRAGEGHEPTLRTVRSALRGEGRDVVQMQRESQRRRAEEEAKLEHALRGENDATRVRYAKLLDWARVWTQALNDRHGLGVGLLWEKEIVWHTAQRLVGEGLLQHVEELLWIPREDFEAFVASGDESAFAQAREHRIAEFRRARRMIPPEYLGKEPEPADEELLTAASDTQSREAELSEGERETQDGVSCGVARGDERVEILYRAVGFAGSTARGRLRKVEQLDDADLLDTLGPEDILLLPGPQAFPHADWHSLLTTVAGVLSPSRPAHHLCQVARECGVPVLGEIPEAIGQLAEGTEVELDAKAGEIRVRGGDDRR